MKKVFSLLLILGLSLPSMAQSSAMVRRIFLGLPLDASRKLMLEQLRSEKRFHSTDTATTNSIDIFGEAYLGLSTDNGVVKINPDSLEVELTWGYSGVLSTTRKKSDDYTRDLILKLRYYYTSPADAEAAYNGVLQLLRGSTRDTSTSGIDTIFSDSPIRSQLKTTGMQFVYHHPWYTVDVQFARITKDYFGLFLEYNRKEKYPY
ncbi:hypothetical protein [Ferruginibacter sp. SUN106]|uniref:hypothetical protein n=1 Tax=Ferruginibacter sp. SUN106 TaxID=2978348 RepID=UPI003D35D07C